MTKPVDGIRVAHIGQSTTLVSVAASALGYGNRQLVTSGSHMTDTSSSKLGTGVHLPIPSCGEVDCLQGVLPWTGKPKL